MFRFLIFFIPLISLISFAQNPLTIPPALTGASFNLMLQEGTSEFYTGTTTNTMGANGSLLGPTLILNKGDEISISVTNQLQEETTIHWHGMHVSPENDGGPHTGINPGETWNPQFTVMDRAGLNWYHPHLHMHTNKHVSRGIAGLIIVKDSEEEALELPRTYGVDDFPLIFQTKGFDVNGQIEWMSHLDTSFMTNGTVNAIVDVPAQVVRFRLLNGSAQRVFLFGISGNIPFQLIGTDGGLLENPVELTRYQIAPGQRADILVDLAAFLNQSIQFVNYGSELGTGIYGSSQPGMMSQLTSNLVGYTANQLNGSDFNMLDLNVISPTVNAITSIPSTLVSHTIPVDGTQDANRSLTFTSQQNIVGPFLINGSGFDMNVINYTIPLGNREVWTLTNQSPIAHPFHIHDIQFYILDINGVPPPPELSGLNDVVLVPSGMGTVRFITEFTDFANDSVPYMYHCHMLTHEDEGMMGQFVVSDPSSDLIKLSNSHFQIFPNPAEYEITIVSNQQSLNGNISISDSFGRIVYDKEINTINSMTLDVSSLNSGIYFVKIKNSIAPLVVQ